MEKIIEKLMEQTEDCLKEYSKKPEWTPQDLECIYKAVKTYDVLQTIKMNTGVWEQIKGDVMHDDHSSRHYSVPGYGTVSYARGRDAATGRYVSRRNNPVYYEGRLSYGHDEPYMSERSMHSINDQMVQRLEGLMDQAGSEYEREKILDVIKRIREAN